MKRFHPLLPGLALAAALLILVFIRHPDSSTSHDRDAKDETVDRAAPATTQEKSAPKARLTSAASGRLQRPLTGLSDLQLTKGLDLRWDEPVQEPVFEEFRRWVENWRAAGGQADLEQGIELAQQRCQELLDLIDKDPRRALELAVPESVRRRLPAAILALLEERVETRGDLLVEATALDNGGCQITRTATLRDGRSFDAYTFGRRGAMPTRDNIAIHGVALDGKLALSDLPGRVLEPTEVAARVAASGVLESCPDLNGSAHQTVAGDGIVIAWDDTRMTRCCDEAHAIAALIYEEGLEQSAAPAYGGEDFDGVIAASPWTEGQKTMLIIRVDFPDYQGQVVDDATLEQLITDMNTLYGEMSSGKASFALLGQGSTITPTVRMPNNTTSYGSWTSLGKVLNDALAVAAAAGYNYLDYTHEVVVTGAKPRIAGTAGVARLGRAGHGCTTRSGTSKPAATSWATTLACRIPVRGTRMTAASSARARSGTTAMSST